MYSKSSNENNSSSSRGGSNNCYVWSLDSSHGNRRAERYDRGCPKSKTMCSTTNGHDSDNEFLLPKEKHYSSDDGECEQSEHHDTTDNKLNSTNNKVRKNHYWNRDDSSDPSK